MSPFLTATLREHGNMLERCIELAEKALMDIDAIRNKLQEDIIKFKAELKEIEEITK